MNRFSLDPVNGLCGALFVAVGIFFAVQSLGLEAKGLWLVDFDNGEGYYCWSYPEPTIAHYHTYDAGFAGRITIQ